MTPDYISYNSHKNKKHAYGHVYNIQNTRQTCRWTRVYICNTYNVRCLYTTNMQIDTYNTDIQEQV